MGPDPSCVQNGCESQILAGESFWSYLNPAIYLDPNSPTYRHIIALHNHRICVKKTAAKDTRDNRVSCWRPPLANQHCHEQTWQPTTPQIRLGQKIWLDKEVKLNPFFSACVYFPQMVVKRSIANTQKACPVLARTVWWMFPALSSKISGAVAHRTVSILIPWQSWQGAMKKVFEVGHHVKNAHHRHV